MMGKITIQSTVLFIVLLLFSDAPAFAITIADKGTAKAFIVIDKRADEPEQHAAKELADFLGQITGAHLISLIERKMARTLKMLMQKGVRFSDNVNRGVMRIIHEAQVSPAIHKAKVIAALKALHRKKKLIRGRQVAAAPAAREREWTQIEAHLRKHYDIKEGTVDVRALARRFQKENYQDRLDSLGGDDPSPEDLLGLVMKAHELEKEHLATHYSVFSATGVKARIVFWLLTGIAKRIKLLAGDKVFRLRMEGTVRHSSMAKFKIYWNKYFKKDLWKDVPGIGFGDEVISVNLSPFGGSFGAGENTYEFLVHGTNFFDPTELLVKFLEAYGFDVAYAERIKRLFEHHLLRGKRGYRNLFHFLIPKSRLNDFVYISWAFGTPDKDREDAARYLHMYRTNPFDPSMYEMQDLQARVVLFPDLYDHVKLVNHNLISEKHKRRFKQDGESLLDEMFDEWEILLMLD